MAASGRHRPVPGNQQGISALTTELPIEPLLPDIRRTLSDHPALVLQAPPGAGKTTQVPLALRDAQWLTGTIIILEPRRLAARAAATRMAELLGEPVGQTVGYQVRFERKVSKATRIEVVTEGILTRRLQHDPELTGVGLVIFDEFHERSLHADLALALCRESQQALRDDLRLLVMSATLDGEAVARLLDQAPILTSEGRSYPVEVHYLNHDPAPAAIVPTTVQTIVKALTEQTGDLLVFLPGTGEIRRVQAALDDNSDLSAIRVLPLYGELSYADQQQALLPDPAGRRKVVLATPIAETSLTIEGISVVIDSGLARQPRFSPRQGLTRLETVRIAADSAEQRAGRAGRLGPGFCYRLWSAATQTRLAPHRPAEILSADLAPLALELAQSGVNDPAALSWLDPPPPGALAQARSLLVELDALDDQGRLTATGKQLATLPLHPRLAHMLIRGAELGLPQLACELAALLDERDIIKDRSIGSDLTLRLAALDGYRQQGNTGARRAGAEPRQCERVLATARQWQRQLMRLEISKSPSDSLSSLTLPGLLLALAYPDRIALQRPNNPGRYQLSSGRGAILTDDDPLVGETCLALAHLDAGDREGRIYLAAPLAVDDLEATLAKHITEQTVINWDSRQQVVIARQQRRLGQLILTSRELNQPDGSAVAQAMTDGIRQMGLDCLPWRDSDHQWQARVLSLRQWLPEQHWPDVSDPALLATLERWLTPYLTGVSRRDHLKTLPLTDILTGLLDWPQQQALTRLAPTHWQVPSGARRPLTYQSDATAPVLAVKLQELFGLAETPRIAEGRVAVTLHLLSPARRPIQVTQDLAGFWNRTYPEVKKELKGRYPKHPWPDDPWNAVPTAGVRRRR